MVADISQAFDPSFKEMFDSAVDRAMLVLGESGRQVIYYHLEKTFGVKRSRWHKDVEGFEEAVEGILGPGAQLLLKAILKELYSTLGLKFEEPKQFRFVDFVRRAERYARGGGND